MPIPYEILLNKKGKVVLARVLLQYDMFHWKYPKNGVWSYLINTPDGIVVFDTGPYFNNLLGFKGKKTNNTSKILDTIKEIMDNKPISQIILSHYHHDHSQNAPELQHQNFTLHGIKAPIRIHKLDKGNKKLLGVLKSGLDRIYEDAGFDGVYIGNDLEQGENIVGLGNTAFEILHTPGHTHGSVSLVNNAEKIVITGWWTGKEPATLVNLGMRFINEDSINIVATKLKLDFSDFRVYYLHKMA